MAVHKVSSAGLFATLTVIAVAGLCPRVTAAEQAAADSGSQRPNILFILTDDHRWDGIRAADNRLIKTPHLDSIVNRGTRFENAFVTLAVCSPSRAACLTGRYGSCNGVTAVGKAPLAEGETTFAVALRDAGYRTGVTGKWHLGTSPKDCGFDFASVCWSNGTWYHRQFTIDGRQKVMPGFVDDVVANESIRFLRDPAADQQPFVLWLCTQVPHMDHRHTWPAKAEYLDQYDVRDMPLPTTWNDDLVGKPTYLLTARNRTQALLYGYDDPVNIKKHHRDYYASVQQMDTAVGRVIDELDALGIRDNTWIILMGDNGWMLGEHGMTSKVLPYEESMRVPMSISGPGMPPQVVSDLVLNIDLTATIYQLAELELPETLHGRSLLPLVRGEQPADWRTSFLYEAPTPQLGSQPLWAVRDDRWKYIETRTGGGPGDVFRELYDLQADAIEANNLANRPQHRTTLNRLSRELDQYREQLLAGDR